MCWGGMQWVSEVVKAAGVRHYLVNRTRLTIVPEDKQAAISL